MPIPSYTRRRFLVSTSVVVAVGAVSIERLAPFSASPDIIVSAELADSLGFEGRSLVLEGPRFDRLQVMAKNLARISGPIVLRLDPVDDHLIDVAAQQAGVSLRRTMGARDGLGTLAEVRPQQRRLA